MEKRVQYKTPEERETILQNHKDMALVEEQNLLTGNFLIFAEEARSIPAVVYTNVPEEELEYLKQENIMNMLAMTDMYETNLRLEQENANTMLAVTELYEMTLGV